MKDLETRTVGSGKDVMFLLGYGITLEQPGTRWIIDKFKDEGIQTTFVIVPTDMTDYQKDILEPCKKIEDRMEDHMLLGLSLGGLAGAYMEKAKKRIFLSPFWGVNDSLKYMGYDTALRRLKTVRYRIIPRKFNVSDAGHYAVKEDIHGIPMWLSFSTLYQMVQMQSAMPPPREDDLVYRSKDDRIISHESIEARKVPIVEYEGGHMIHLVKDRDRIFNDIIGTITKWSN
jgi:esterase/lipase